MNNFAKAYTIMEILISMVIMGIISIITYVVFFSFSMQLQNFEKTADSITKYNMLKNNMKRDFYLAQDISISNTKIGLVLNDSIEHIYEFNKSFIIRDLNNKKDTLPLSLVSVIVIKNTRTKKKIQLNFNVLDEPLSFILANNLISDNEN